MDRACPRLRQDLVLSRQNADEDGEVWVLKDPASGRFFRFRGAEHFILQQLDGQTSLAEIRERVERHFDAELPAGMMQQFVGRLWRCGLLAGDTEAAEKASTGAESSSRAESSSGPESLSGTESSSGARTSPRPKTSPGGGVARGRVRGNLLYLRFKAFDPEDLFEWLHGRVRFFFTPGFVALAAVMIVAALALTFAHSGRLSRDLMGLYSVRTLLPALLMFLVVGGAHEFAHGLTCKHFGGEVRELGFMLLYFQPALYCNVSDAWLFPEKSQRLWVTFAGAYFELFLWALATFVWWAFDPATWISWAALLVMAMSGIRTFFNLNPLIKLDGYYLLSDYLEVPNLRSRAVAFLMERVRRAWRATGGGSPVVADPAAGGSAADLSPRRRRIYLGYGVLAMAYSSLLLIFIVGSFSGYLIGNYQAWGLVLSLVFVSAVVGGRFGGMRRLAASASGKLRGLVGSGDGDGDGQDGGPSPRRLALIVGLPVLVLVLAFGRMELKVSGEFTVMPSHNADVRARVDGIIEEVLVEEGDRVEAREPIVRLSDREYRQQLRQVEAEIAEARARLGMLEAGARSEELALAETQVRTARSRRERARQAYEEAREVHAEQVSRGESSVAKAEERLRYANQALDTARSLFDEKLIARRQLDEAEELVMVREKELEEAQADLRMLRASDLAQLRQSLDVAEMELEEAGRRLDLLRAGTRAGELEATEATVRRLETRRSYLAEQIELSTIVSPIDGVVATPKLRERLGEHLSRGDLVAEVYGIDTVRAEIPIPEKEIADVEVGDRVELKARAFPGEQFTGRVVSIAPVAQQRDRLSGTRSLIVITEIDNPSMLLKPEMSGAAKIHCGPRRIVSLLTRRLVRSLRVELWSWW